MMYESIVLRNIARLMLPVLMLLALFMLFRGHNLPGGGFIGGLVGSCAIILQMIAFGPDAARDVVRINYLMLAAFGVFFGAIWGIPGLLAGQPFMTSFWLPERIPGIGTVGTPVLFDIGVFLTVIGVTTKVALLLSEEPILFPIEFAHEEYAQDDSPAT